MSDADKLSLRNMSSFGRVAAEHEPVLKYFLSTDAVRQIESGEVFLVIGRKGTDKTAIVRHFTESRSDVVARALNLNNYPWKIHESRIDLGSSEIEAYVSSWRYIIAAQLASLAVSGNIAANDSSKSIIEFFNRNYGIPNPQFSELITPDKLSVSGLSFEPSILGNKLGSIVLSSRSDQKFGRELDALTDGLLNAVVNLRRPKTPLSLHFDELDTGLSDLDRPRRNMIIGLILATKSVNQKLNASSLYNFVIYLRSDIWDGLSFSDKNKINTTFALSLIWNDSSLRRLIDERIRASLGDTASWDNIIDDGLMRGSQPKWRHILARTFLRPRDVIQFLNTALELAKGRIDEPLTFMNDDINKSRERYSSYLKKELDDEIRNHWDHWDEALQACSQIATITFERENFTREYERRRPRDNKYNADEALRLLFEFSVIGYEKRIGGGGSGWFFRYAENSDAWDNTASRFKVHQGLKEFAKLKEDRQIQDWNYVLEEDTQEEDQNLFDNPDKKT